jgi:hypothetical protein
MQIFKSVWRILMALPILTSSFVLADDHMLNGMNVQQPFNLQANLCKLNPGVSLEDYHAMVEDYLAWAETNDVDPVFVRQFPLFSHQTLQRPWPYDFVEFLASDYERWGKSWDLWLTSKSGMALNERWQELAVCDVKQAHSQVLYANREALESDDERYVTWNWCTPKVGFEQLSQKHAQYVAELTNNPRGMIGWAVVFPHTGAANMPGEFAHLAVYPDMESFMTRRKSEATGGWRGQREYEQNYADCTGEQLNIETVLHRP